MKRKKNRRQRIVIIEREPQLSAFEAAMLGPMAFNTAARVVWLVIMLAISLFVAWL